MSSTQVVGLLVPEVFKIESIWLDVGSIWSDLVPKVVNNSQTKYVPRNDPKRSGSGSYSLVESWEPVLYYNNVFLYHNKGPFFPIIHYPYSPVKFPIPLMDPYVLLEYVLLCYYYLLSL